MNTRRKILSTNRFTKKKYRHGEPEFRAAIIPHAGTKFAGQVRESVFSKMKERHKHNAIKKIIYIYQRFTIPPTYVKAYTNFQRTIPLEKRLI